MSGGASQGSGGNGTNSMNEDTLLNKYRKNPTGSLNSIGMSSIPQVGSIRGLSSGQTTYNQAMTPTVADHLQMSRQEKLKASLMNEAGSMSYGQEEERESIHNSSQDCEIITKPTVSVLSKFMKRSSTDTHR